MTPTVAQTCPECRNPMTVERYIPAATIAEFVVGHRVLSGNRWDSPTIVIRKLGEPTRATDAEMRVEACEQVLARFDPSDAPRLEDLVAGVQRRRVQPAERVMACTVCTHTHREADER